jgi:hypothetical protein
MKIFGIILIVLGLSVILFSGKIVFPGLESIIGIETIVGKDSVVYDKPGDPNSGYVFTNPEAMIKWVASVALCGFVILIVGIGIAFKNKIMKLYNQTPSGNPAPPSS